MFRPFFCEVISRGKFSGLLGGIFVIIVYPIVFVSEIQKIQEKIRQQNQTMFEKEKTISAEIAEMNSRLNSINNTDDVSQNRSQSIEQIIRTLTEERELIKSYLNTLQDHLDKVGSL